MTTSAAFKSLQDHFQFLVILILFLPTIANALYGGSTAQLDANKQMLTWGAVIAVLVADYLLMEILKHRLIWSVGKWVDRLVLLNVAASAPVFYIMAAYGSTEIKGEAGIIFFFSLLLLMFMPLVNFILLFAHGIFSTGKWYINSFKNN